MLLLVDAFSELVERARLELSRAEGHDVSVRELARRAGLSESTLRYQLAPREGRLIPRDLIQRLAGVLPVEERDLLRAAQVTAGIQIEEDLGPDLGQVVVRYLQQPLSREERTRALLRLQEILAEEIRRSLEARNGNGKQA